MIDIKDLESFIAIIDTGSISKAAEDIGLSQPALSLKLKKIETELGLQLFQRTSRSVLPLETARTIEPHVRDVLSRVDSIKEALANTIHDLKGTVRIGCLMGWFDPLLIPFTKRINIETPLIKLRLHADNTSDNLLYLLAHGRIDIAIVAQPFEITEGLVTQHLLDEELVLIGKNLPKTEDAMEFANAMIKRTWITTSNPDILVDKYWRERFAGAIFPWENVRVPIIVDHITSIVGIVANIPDSVAVVPRQIVSGSFNTHGLEMVGTVSLRNGLYLAWRREGMELQRYHVVKKYLEEQAKFYMDSRNHR